MKNVINDRGAKKWGRIMLPEYKEKISILYKEEYSNKQTHSKMIAEELNFLINEALYMHLKVNISYFRDKKEFNAIGNIYKVDLLNRTLILKQESSKRLPIFLDDIFNIDVEKL